MNRNEIMAEEQYQRFLAQDEYDDWEEFKEWEEFAENCRQTDEGIRRSMEKGTW